MGRRLSLFRLLAYLLVLSAISGIILSLDLLITKRNDGLIDPYELRQNNLVSKEDLLNPVRKLVNLSPVHVRKVDRYGIGISPAASKNSTTTPYFKAKKFYRNVSLGREILDEKIKNIPSIVGQFSEPTVESRKINENENGKSNQNGNEQKGNMLSMLHDSLKKIKISRNIASDDTTNKFDLTEKRRIEKALQSYDPYKNKKIHLNPQVVKAKTLVNELTASKKSEDILDESDQSVGKTVQPMVTTQTTTTTTKVKKTTKPKKRPVPSGVLHDIDKDEISLSDSEVEEYKSIVAEINEKQEIYNLDKFGQVASDSNIILIQVHSRVRYLELLIESLKEAKYINETLVIFSHDIWKPAINKVIHDIKSFRYMQMFFPFSVQLHPRKFPGKDPRDCLWNHKKRSKIHYKVCLNEDWADSYGHYREPRFTQIKHHWWWKINRFFDVLDVTKGWTGDVLFLEDDHYVAPDFLHVLRLLRATVPAKGYNVLSIGNFNKMTPLNTNTGLVVNSDWGGAKYNLGFAFGRETWKKIKEQSNFFCTFDDYNWDWSLTVLMVNSNHLKGSMWAVKVSRVYHLGTCGTHSKNAATCNYGALVESYRTLIQKSKKHFFPKSLGKATSIKNAARLKKPNGGWKDFRDMKLCKAVAKNNATDATIDSLQFEDFKI